MSAQLLQTLSQIAIAVGVIFTAFGGFGAYYFGKAVDREKEQETAKNEAALRGNVDKLLDGNVVLQKKLEPFEKLAQQLHPAQGNDEALESLKRDLQHLTERASTIEKQAAPRSLSERQIKQIAANLGPAPGGGVSVTSVMGDQEAFMFAVALKSVLERGGWKVDGVNQAIYTNPIRGLIITVRNEPAPNAADRLLGQLNATGFTTVGNLNPNQPENSVWLIVGSKA